MAQRPKSRAAGAVKSPPKPAPSPRAKKSVPVAASKTDRKTPTAPPVAAVEKRLPPGAGKRAGAAGSPAKTPPMKSKPAKASAVKSAVAPKTTRAAPAPTKAKRRPAAAAAPEVARPMRATKPTTPVGRSRTEAAARPAKAAPSAKPVKKKGSDAARGTRTRKAPLPYLAVELGQPSDHDGEPIGAGSAKARSDEDLQRYALQLWRQMQSGRVVNRYVRAIERAGLTTDEVWTAGLGEVRTTSSTADEIRRYRQKVLFRANLLEAILTETVADLNRLEGIEPATSGDEALPPANDPKATGAAQLGAPNGRPRGA